jgi:hypothetical protein
MNNNLYIVSASEGEYSGRTDWNICIVSDEKRAEEVVAKLNLLQEYNNNFAKNLAPAFEEQYELEHPPPAANPPRPVLGPNYSNQLQQKQHMKACEKWNQQCLAQGKIRNQWHDQFIAARKLWFDEVYCPDPSLREVVHFGSIGSSYFPITKIYYRYETCPIFDYPVFD